MQQCKPVAYVPFSGSFSAGKATFVPSVDSQVAADKTWITK